MDESFYDPRFDRVLSKLSTTIDKTDFRNAEADAREQFNLEWKQVKINQGSLTYSTNAAPVDHSSAGELGLGSHPLAHILPGDNHLLADHPDLESTSLRVARRSLGRRGARKIE